MPHALLRYAVILVAGLGPGAGAVAGEAAWPAACRGAPLTEHSVVQAPALRVGTEWAYSVGGERPASRMRLARVEDGVGFYRIDGAERAEYSERLDRYAQPNALRQGEKVLLRFPLRVGASWQDQFSEPGEVARPIGTYRYRYSERALNRVVAVEEVSIGLGTMPALRIERDAFWTKSDGESEDMDQRNEGSGEVEGLDRSVSWYVPALGRVVLRKQVRMHPSYQAFKDADDDTRDVRITELVAYQDPAGCRLEAAPTQARMNDADQHPLGFPIRFNDTWEFLFQRHEHRPREDKADQ